MPFQKKDLQAKIRELSALANTLPAGDAKASIDKLITNLDLVTEKTLLPDGKSHPDIAKMIPKTGLNPNSLSEGDGHAITCC